MVSTREEYSTTDFQGEYLPPSCRVLILNRNWQAVNIVGVRRAMSLLWSDHARVINTFDQDYTPYDASRWIAYSSKAKSGAGKDFIRTIRLNILVPKVLLLNEFDRLPVTEVKFNRENVFIRDNHTCQYTGKRCKPSELTLDHVIPRDRGGRTSWENIVTCRRDINSKKGNRLPHEANLNLMKKPARPRWKPFATVVAEGVVDDAWRVFIHAEKNAS